MVTATSQSSFGSFLQAVAQVGDNLTLRAGPAGLNETVASEGGFIVPPTWAGRVLEKVYDVGEILRRCDRIPPGKSDRVIAPYIHESSRAAGSRFGGMSVAWLADGAQVSASTPDIGLQTRKLNKVAGLVYVTNELLSDAPMLGAFIERVAALELGFVFESAIVSGTGAGTPLGVLNAPCKITATKATNQTAATVWGSNVISMMSRLWGPSWRRAVWLVNPSATEQLSRLTAPSDYTSASSGYTEGASLWDWRPSPTSGGWPTLCGRPAIPCEHCSAVGTEGDIVLVDLSQYAVSDKANDAWSMHIRFLYDESAYRFELRCDGAPTWASALTPTNGSTTLSPIVTLQTRE